MVANDYEAYGVMEDLTEVNISFCISSGHANEEITQFLRTMIQYLPEKYKQALYLNGVPESNPEGIGGKNGFIGIRCEIEGAKGTGKVEGNAF